MGGGWGEGVGAERRAKAAAGGSEPGTGDEDGEAGPGQWLPSTQAEETRGLRQTPSAHAQDRLSRWPTG